PFARDDHEDDAAKLVLKSRELLAEFNRPTLLAEFGYNGTNDFNPFNEADQDGIALHNALWAGVFCKHSGTPMNWWWDYYLEANELQYHYQVLSQFLEGVDWTLPKQSMVSDSDHQARVMVLIDSKWTGIWVQNKAATWENRLENKSEPQVMTDVTVRLSGYEAGYYLIEWMDPYNGETISTEIKAPEKGNFSLPVPPFNQDIAGRLLLLKETENTKINPGENKIQN
ncbi:MAG: hypothetical protein JXA52_05045, partial [Planctomycetes bacterium]|nr:hypothetical protein [Planctomycetota bacterium]